jgi:hypothetical protein
MTLLRQHVTWTASYHERKRWRSKTASSKVLLFLNFLNSFSRFFFRAFIPMSPFPLPLFCQQIETSLHLGPWKSDDNVERDIFVLGKSRQSMKPARLEQIVFTRRNSMALNFPI